MESKTTDNRRTANRLRKLPGLHIQAPWSQWILTGIKTIETRFYPLPEKYVGQEMALIETPGRDQTFKARIVGTITFGKSFRYKNEKHFASDVSSHLVDGKSKEFNWRRGKSKWGWPILKVKKRDQGLPPGLKRGIVYTKEVLIHL